MAKRRSSRKRPSKTTMLPKAAEMIGFTEADEEFFRAGDSQEHLEQQHGALYESAPERPSFWRRLFARATLAA